MTDQWFSKGSDGYDKARVVLEIVELGGEIRLGVTMKNYRASNMDDDISPNRRYTTTTFGSAVNVSPLLE